MMKIAAENKRMELVELTYSQTIAVTHSLDVGFNNGKGNILKDWVENMVGELLTLSKKSQGKQADQPVISEKTFALLDSLPKFTKKKEE